MRVRLLGPLEVGSGEAQPGPRDRVVLAALAVHPGHVLETSALSEALWPDGAPPSGPKVVQGCISRLRAVLGPAAIQTSGHGYRLDPLRVELDRDEFEQLAAEGREELASSAPERAAVLFERALGLWRGRPFPELDEWLAARLEATRLQELRLAVEEDLLRAWLDAGRHHDAATRGTVLVGEEPWRERRWELLALAQYRCGRQADALASIRTARRALGRELGLDPGSDLVVLERAILTQDPALAAEHDARAASSWCPWRGLASYEAEDRDSFFGRDADVEACLARLEESPLLALVGPSGSGKSSLLKAGLVAALRQRGRDVVVFEPGRDPLAATAAARASTAGDPVLCVDQFEELFTSRLSNDDRRSWLAGLADYARQHAPVLLAARSDFVSELGLEPAFAGLVERGMHLVQPLGEELLRAVVEGPARMAGLHLEHGLVDLLLRDAADRPGALPLLSHALAETWRAREGSLLTVEGYRTTGGISGAVAASADRLCDSLTDEGRDQLRWLMLRMGTVAEHGEPVRTPLPREVAADDPDRLRVAELLVRARLVTLTDGSFELAHESLMKAWPRLRGWLEEDRAGQRLWRHLANAASEWDALGRPDTELYQGVRLDAAREWASRDQSQPTRLEQEFLDASVAHADTERSALERQARHERRLNRRLRGLLVGVGGLLVLALVATLLAVDQQRTAARQRDVAGSARQDALHESLVARSLSLRSTNRAVAALLAVEAWRARRDPLAESALLGTFTSAPGFLGYRTTPYRFVQGAPIPGTRRAVMGSGNKLHVVDLETGRLGPEFASPIPDNSGQQVLRVSGDGTRVAQLLFDPREVEHCGFYEALLEDDGRRCTLLTVFDIATRRPVLGPVSTPFSGGDLAIDHSGSVVAVTGGFDGDLATWDVDRGRRLGRLPGLPRPETAYNWRDTGAVAFDRTSRLFLGSLAGPVREVDPRTLDVVDTLPAPPLSTHNFLTVTPDGLLVATGDDFLVAMRKDSGEQVWRVDLTEDTDLWPCTAAAVAPAMDRLYCASVFGEIEERDLRNGQLTGVRRDPQLGEPGDLTIARDDELVVFSYGYYRWRLDGTGPIARMVAPRMVTVAGYDGSGRYLDVVPFGALGRYDTLERIGPHTVLDLETGRSVRRIDMDAYSIWVGDRTLALFDDRGRMHLADRESGEPRRPADAALRRTEWAFRTSDPRIAWAQVPDPPAPHQTDTGQLVEFDVTTGTATGRKVRVPGSINGAMSTDGGDALWVTYVGAGTHLAYDNQERFSAALFRPDGTVSDGMFAYESAITDPGDGLGRLVISDETGQLSEHDPRTAEEVAALPGTVGSVFFISYDADGSRLLTVGANNLAQLYDSADWTRIGAIPADSTDAFREAWLRPDGRAVAANGRRGVVEWDLDPGRMAEAACVLAGRNLTRAEWTTYMGDQGYRRTCPQYPVGA